MMKLPFPPFRPENPNFYSSPDSIYRLDLATRSYNVLRLYNVESIVDLQKILKKDPKWIMRLKSSGKKTQFDILNALAGVPDSTELNCAFLQVSEA